MYLKKAIPGCPIINRQRFYGYALHSTLPEGTSEY
eukprot:SAG31_NODE_28018_length_416_cov_1.441640_1_plen_34_part_10